MKLVALISALAAMLALSSVAWAQEPTPVTGEFTVEPTSGPVGTVVTLTGALNQDINFIRFDCLYRDTNDEGILDVPLEPAGPSFQTTVEIPATLALRQRSGETRATAGDCEFRATASHQLLFKSVPFTVTSDGLPSTGHGPVRSTSAWPAIAAGLLVTAGVLTAGAGGRRFRSG